MAPQDAKPQIRYNYKGQEYALDLHSDFVTYTQHEKKLFVNIFNILRNLQVQAMQATDIGFVKLFQSILLLHGATIRVKTDVEEANQRLYFEQDDKTEKPKNLMKLQSRMAECGASNFVRNMISISYEDYERNRSTYFAEILSASINLGSTLLSYGNSQIQN